MGLTNMKSVDESVLGLCKSKVISVFDSYDVISFREIYPLIEMVKLGSRSYGYGYGESVFGVMKIERNLKF